MRVYHHPRDLLCAHSACGCPEQPSPAFTFMCSVGVRIAIYPRDTRLGRYIFFKKSITLRAAFLLYQAPPPHLEG